MGLLLGTDRDLVDVLAKRLNQTMKVVVAADAGRAAHPDRQGFGPRSTSTDRPMR
jgi:hypothetical protein